MKIPKGLRMPRIVFGTDPGGRFGRPREIRSLFMRSHQPGEYLSVGPLHDGPEVEFLPQKKDFQQAVRDERHVFPGHCEIATEVGLGEIDP